jgi:superfamily II DNA/RNA helicase
MQHVVQRHSTRALIQHTSTGLLIAALTGDMTQREREHRWGRAHF